MFTEADLVYSFTRADAFAEGMFIDASAVAAEAGFRVPLAMTDTVWNDCVAWPEGTKGGWGQSESGRLWDVVWMAACAARRGRDAGRSRVEFEVLRVPQGGGSAKPVRLLLTIGPGDAGEPVATVMAPGEE
jgi:hypothetical protein